jgi:hypothetical protein
MPFVVKGMLDRRLVDSDGCIKRKDNGERFVTFDRGGGHLGYQGYVYSPDAEDTTQVHNEVFGGYEGYEGYELWYLYGSWWSYESTQD